MTRLRSTAVAALVAAVVAGCGGAPESGAPEEEVSEGEAAVRIVPRADNTIHLDGRNTPGTWQILDSALSNVFAVRRISGQSRAYLVASNATSQTMQACGQIVCPHVSTSTTVPINVTLRPIQANFFEVQVATLPKSCGIFTVDLTVGPPASMSLICGFF
jgi:hypothetical protein